jgi:transcriptional regulator with XRE-family HTH domain
MSESEGNTANRLADFLKNTGFSIPEIVVKCGIEKSKRTIYKIVNDGHKPSPRILRAIKEQFPELDIPYILTGGTNAVQQKSKENFNNTNFTQQEKIMIEQTESFNEMKETLNKTVLMQSEMMNRFLMKFQDMEASNIKLRGEVIELMKGMETIKEAQEQITPVVLEHIEIFNDFRKVILPETKLGESVKIKKKH